MPLPCSNLPLDHSRQGHRARYTDGSEGREGKTSDEGALLKRLRGWKQLLSLGKKKEKEKLAEMTARGKTNAFAHMAAKTARGTHAEIRRRCGSLITPAYWPEPTTTTTTKHETRARASPTNPSRPKPPPRSERGGTDFCHAASPSCSDRRSRNLRRGGAFMRIIPRWAPGCCSTSSPVHPFALSSHNARWRGKGRQAPGMEQNTRFALWFARCTTTSTLAP